MKFKLCLYGSDGTFKEYNCLEYDLDNMLVRFKDTVYDIEYGRWVVRLDHIRFGFGTWNDKKIPQCTTATLLSTVLKSDAFMQKLAKKRSELKNRGVHKIQEYQLTLF